MDQLCLANSSEYTTQDRGGQSNGHRHLPLYYYRRQGMANLNGQACSDLARLYRAVLAFTEIQQGISGHNASWQGTMVNT